jgi:hypothetical protein
MTIFGAGSYLMLFFKPNWKVISASEKTISTFFFFIRMDEKKMIV